MVRAGRCISAGVLAPVLALLLHCGGEAAASRDGGAQSDATAGGPRGGSASPGGTGTCGASGAPCALDASGPPCDGGWQCAVEDCSGATASETTLTGSVFDPSGTTPLPNVAVFIPNDVSTLPTVTEGTNTCTCLHAIGDYVTAAISDANGTFKLTGVPTGRAVPVTVQTGKWRRTVYWDIAQSCATNAVPDGTLRLPRSRAEGDMPQMALVTGGFDDLGCALQRMGIDPGEYSAPGAGGRLEVYRGVAAADGSRTGTGPGLSSGTAGDCTTDSCPLWASKAALEHYDVVLLSCEGDPYLASKSPSAIQAMHDWLNEGGKLFATHSQAVWFEKGPPEFQNAAVWRDFSTPLASGTYSVQTTFPEGKAFETWLDTIGAAMQAFVPLGDVSDSVTSANDPSSIYLEDPSSIIDHPKILSFETPLGGVLDAGGGIEREYCGEAVFTDVHAGVAPSGDLPGSCPAGPLTAQDRTLEFFVFSQPSCVFVLTGKGPP